MECSNNNNITPMSSSSLPKQMFPDESKVSKETREKITSVFQEFIQFLEKITSTEVVIVKEFMEHKQKLCLALKWEWSIINWLFNSYIRNITVLELIQMRIGALAKEALAPTNMPDHQKKEMPIEVIPIQRDTYLGAFFELFQIEEEEYKKLNEASQYRDKLHVIKKNKEKPYYQIAENEDINAENTNLIFDPKLLEQIPEDKREILLRHFKPHMLTPRDICICFTHFENNQKKTFRLTRIMALQNDCHAVGFIEHYKEMQSNFQTAFYDIQLKEKIEANKINLQLTNYIKQLKKEQTEYSNVKNQNASLEKMLALITLCYVVVKRYKEASQIYHKV